MVLPVTGQVPDPNNAGSESERRSTTRALEYMGLEPNTNLEEIAIDRVFIGSCTNGESRIWSPPQGLFMVTGLHRMSAMVVPGSHEVKIEPRARLDKIFIEAGFEWREAGCSMCLGMNPDILQPGERCASTSNRILRVDRGAADATPG